MKGNIISVLIMKYSILVFFKFKELTKEQEERAKSEWEKMVKEMPPEVKIISVNDHAWGTTYNGFMILEADNFDAYVKFWKWFKDKVRWYVDYTQTVIGLKRE